MTRALALRRIAVVAGLAVAMLAAGGTVLAAAQWAATEAPLAVAPVTGDSLQQALDHERARSAALEEQLAALEGASGDLSAALSAAQDQLVTDASTARELRTALDAARARLAELEAAMRDAATQRVSVAGRNTGTTSGSSFEDEHDDDHETDDD